MEQSMSTTVQNYLNRLTCTLFVLMGLLGLLAPASHAAKGAFSFSAATSTVSEGAGKIDITINRLGGSTGAASVTFQTKQISALAGSDFVNIPMTTLNFAHREQKKVVSVAIANDTVVDPNETFEVLLSNPTYGTILGSISNSVITIQDDDIVAPDTTAPTVSLTSPANATTFTSAQTVTITAAASDNVGVSKVELYDGVTLLSTDTSAPYSFAWAITSANNGSHSLSAKAYDAAGNSKVSAASNISVNIPTVVLNSGAFQFSTSNYSVLENAGKVNITISRVGGSSGPATIEWRTQTFDGIGTADWANDYGTFLWTTINFVDGETSKVLPITVNNDAVYEGDETFSVLLQNPTNGATIGTPSRALVTIKDDDTIAVDTIAPTVSISSAAVGTTLTSAQTVTITSSAQDNIGVTKVEFYDGTILKGVNSSSVWPVSSASDSGSIVASASWSVSAADNGSHTITAKAYDAAGNVKQSSSIVITVNIPVAGSNPSAFQFSASSYSVLENAGKINITINRVGGSFGPATVEWRTQTFDGIGTADWANDYGTFLWTAINFVDGETSKVLPITVNNDAAYEGDETFSVLLQNPTNGATIGTPSRALITIKDDDTTGSTPPPATSGPLRTFPGAEGFGSETPGGRGGQIIKVTNLNDSGAGSLRAAIETVGARTIVFEVGGTIRLNSFMWIKNPFLTIAGQTAPEPGIQIIGAGFYIQAHDILIQHLRIRPGDELPGVDVFSARNSLVLMSGAYNVVIDHNTLTWSTDENLAAWTKDKAITDVTWSNNINAESLTPGNGGVIGSSVMTPKIIDRFSVIKNLYAHNNERNPTVSAYCDVFVANNLAYNPYREFSVVGINGGPGNASFIGNHYITGKSSLGSAVIATLNGSTVYLQDNKISGPVAAPLFGNFAGVPALTLPTIYDKSVKIMPVNEVYNYVTRNAGARPALRDSVEVRIINDVLNGTGVIKSSVSAAGGWPYDYQSQTYRAFILPNNPNGDDDSDGYTNIEEILHQMSKDVETVY